MGIVILGLIQIVGISGLVDGLVGLLGDAFPHRQDCERVVLGWV